MEKLLLRPAEAAECLGICQSRVYEMLARNDLPGTIRIGRSVRISRQALEQWIDEQVNHDRKEVG